MRIEGDDQVDHLISNLGYANSFIKWLRPQCPSLGRSTPIGNVYLQLSTHTGRYYYLCSSLLSFYIVENMNSYNFITVNITLYVYLALINLASMGSGCGSVGTAVASDTRGPGFEYSHWQLLNIYFLLIACRKDENKEKEAGNGPFKKNLQASML